MFTFLDVVEDNFYELSVKEQYTKLKRTTYRGRNALYSLIQDLANCNDANAKEQLSRKTATLLQHMSRTPVMDDDNQQYNIFFPSRSSLSRNWDLLPLIVEQLDPSMQREFVSVILSWRSPKKCKEIYAQFQVEGCPFANHHAAYFLSFLLYGMEPEKHNIFLQDTRLALPLRFLIACFVSLTTDSTSVTKLMKKMSPTQKMQLFIDSNILNYFDRISDDNLKAQILQQLSDDPKQYCELFTPPRALGNFLLSNDLLLAAPGQQRIMPFLESLRTLSLNQRNQMLRHLKDYIDSVDPAKAEKVFKQFIMVGADSLLFPLIKKSGHKELMPAIVNHCLNPELNQGSVDSSAWKIDLYKEQVELTLWLGEFEDRCHRLSDKNEKAAAEQLHQKLYHVFHSYLCSTRPIYTLTNFQSDWHTAIKNAPSILSASHGWGEFFLKGLICMTGIGLLLLASLEIKAKRDEKQKNSSLAGINISVPNKSRFFPHVHFLKSANGEALQDLDKQVDKIVAIQSSFSPNKL